MRYQKITAYPYNTTKYDCGGSWFWLFMTKQKVELHHLIILATVSHTHFFLRSLPFKFDWWTRFDKLHAHCEENGICIAGTRSTFDSSPQLCCHNSVHHVTPLAREELINVVLHYLLHLLPYLCRYSVAFRTRENIRDRNVPQSFAAGCVTSRQKNSPGSWLRM